MLEKNIVPWHFELSGSMFTVSFLPSLLPWCKCVKALTWVMSKAEFRYQLKLLAWQCS